MLKQNEIKRLKKLGFSVRAIAKSLKCSRKTVRKYLSEERAEDSKPSTPPPWVLSLDWEDIHREHTGKKGVPLNVLWEERVESGSVPVSYAGFWKQYKVNRRVPAWLNPNGNCFFYPVSGGFSDSRFKLAYSQGEGGSLLA